ncbi:MAG: nitrilase-related carbon-nitrogen hydrolase [Acidobacteriota bacterium]
MSESQSGDSFRAVALQITCRSVNRFSAPADARAAIADSIRRLDAQIGGAVGWIGGDTRLVVVPEYFLTGFPMGETAQEWAEKACLEIDGKEYEALGEIAQRHGIFLAGNAYELDSSFPGLYFQVSFILGPSGDVVLRYRRLNSMFSPTPHDVWDRYLELYGLEGVFPVAKTEIGNLAAVASEEILYPEVARCMALRGAEVLVHSTCEVASPRPTPKGITKVARAIENMAYVVSANTAGMEGIPIPGASSDGGSQVIDYRGLVLAEAGPGESIVAYAELDMAALRRYRRRPGMDNLLSRQRLELYASSYGLGDFYPPNTLSEGAPERDHFSRTQRQTIERLAAKGII